MLACLIALLKTCHLFSFNKLFSCFAETMPRLKDLAAKKSKKTNRESRKIKSPVVEDDAMPLEHEALPFKHETLPSEPEMPIAPKQKGIVINEPDA